MKQEKKLSLELRNERKKPFGKIFEDKKRAILYRFFLFPL